MKSFVYKHIVGFEETNLVGNVYFANHIKWQGRCREMFLREKCPEVIEEIESGELSLVTLNCKCDYLDEILAFDEIHIQMDLLSMEQHTVEMGFNYYKKAGNRSILVARGSQKIACMEKTETGYQAVKIPDSMRIALTPYIVAY